MFSSHSRDTKCNTQKKKPDRIRRQIFTVKAMLDLPQQHTVVVHLRSELQAEGTAGAVALVLAAQGQVGLGTHAGDRDAGVVMTVNAVAAENKRSESQVSSRLDSTHTVQTGAALPHLLPAPVLLSLQLPLQLLQVGLQLGDALAQTVLVQQAVGVLQLQAVATVQGLGGKLGTLNCHSAKI